MLTPRLKKIAEQAVPGLVCADIGTDHGYLPVFLVQKGIIPAAVASDLRSGPLERAAQSVRSAGLTDRIRTVLAPGLEGLIPGEAGQCVIAGMGGQMIIGILGNSPETAGQMKRLILQPQNNERELRIWLSENGYRIIRELTAIEDKRFYSIIVAEPGKTRKLTAFEQKTGCREARAAEPEYQSYLKMLIEKNVRILESSRGGNSEAAADRARETELYLEELKEELETITTEEMRECKKQ
ncbi:MAG: tRNA (adenine(22)-N(1))-methyltransferase [Eubacteriaceae bacterium]|jgi:tRNA (adenine22-N1)-methyltransferase